MIGTKSLKLPLLRSDSEVRLSLQERNQFWPTSRKTPVFLVSNLKKKATYLKKETYVVIAPNVKEFRCVFLNVKEATLHWTF